MTYHPSSSDSAPWWEAVAHLRDDEPAAPARAVAATAVAERPAAEREPQLARPARRQERSPHARRASRPAADWFADEAREAGRRQAPRRPTAPQRPRATLVDLAPTHQLIHRARQERRAPGERPTVTITGRADAALPPQPRVTAELPARRTRVAASALLASPDRLMLWAVALGLLMILASIGTAGA